MTFRESLLMVRNNRSILQLAYLRFLTQSPSRADDREDRRRDDGGFLFAAASKATAFPA